MITQGTLAAEVYGHERVRTSTETLARERILRDEAQDGFSLFQRYGMVLELLEPAQSDKQIMAWLYVVLRFNQMKQLRWYGKYNYQGKDIAHLQDTLSRRMSLAAVHAPDPTSRRLARMAMRFLSRGGGLAEQIRMQILDMMRRHNIREGHRPGVEDRFLEQWHQKLHQNTTPEDIPICEAYLSFLSSGREGDFWQTLWDRGGITRERLASMPNPITASPLHLPQLIPDLQHYLWTLKTVHAGADLHFMIESGKWALEQAGEREALGWLCEIRDNFHAWWIPGKIAQTRTRLASPLRNVFAAERDILLLDAALDAALKTAVERIDLGSLDSDAVIDLIDLVLSQATLSRDGDAEHESCLRQWRAQAMDRSEPQRWSASWALCAKAAAERLALLLTHEANSLCELLQEKADELGHAAGIPPQYVASFSEEVIRGQTEFLLSLLLERLEPRLRGAAGLGRSSVVSLGHGNGSASGTLLFAPTLREAGDGFAHPRVLMVDRLCGTDDIPGGASAVLTGGSIDLLSHVAIRARNQGVLLACCDAELLADLQSQWHEGDCVTVTMTSDVDGLAVTKDDPRSHLAAHTAMQQKVTVPSPAPWRGYLVAPAEFEGGVVGAKARNLAYLASALPSSLRVPRSLALPFGSMEAALEIADNAAVFQAVRSQAATATVALESADVYAVCSALARIRHQITAKLLMDDSLRAALQSALERLGQPASALAQIWDAVKRVWASKWTDRAFLSRARGGVSDSLLYMGVLVQEVVPARCAFVLHTAHPVSMDPGTLLGEVVEGLGETLVGNYPGRPFSFLAPRDPAQPFCVLSYPSKRVGLFVNPASPGLMVRSDSNGEDLESFAGAGLYDSVACGVVREEHVDYASSPLFTDEAFRRTLMEKLRQAGLEVEKAMGGAPQDIEGVLGHDGSLSIVQTRRQVGLQHTAGPEPHAPR